MYRAFFVLMLVKTCKILVLKLKIFLEKFWWFKKKPYLCTRFRSKSGPGALKERVLWKIYIDRSSTRSECLYIIIMYRHLGIRNEPFDSWIIWIVVLWQGLRSRQPGPSRQSRQRYFYNEEFDPGSGWTLATGLTHASRGASWSLLANFDGDRRTGE